MTDKPLEILLVESDPELAEMIGHCLEEEESVQVTRAESASDALREELTARHDAVIASMSLPDGDGLALARELRATNKCPVILMADHPTADEAIEAMRLGVADILVKPFDISEAAETVHELGRRQMRRRHRRRRYRRLRRLSSRIVNERRDLRQRMDLICRDLVHAYRGLAQKVAESGMLTHEFEE